MSRSLESCKRIDLLNSKLPAQALAVHGPNVRLDYDRIMSYAVARQVASSMLLVVEVWKH